MRSSVYQWAAEVASATAKRSTCLRRGVGCVLFDHNNHVLATGYNGVPKSFKHCNEKIKFGEGHAADEDGCRKVDLVTYPNACPGSFDGKGKNLDGCYAIHAEQNALLQCSDIFKIHTCVTTTEPCITCTKLLLNTSCETIVYLDDYYHPEAKDLWLKSGRQWFKFTDYSIATISA